MPNPPLGFDDLAALLSAERLGPYRAATGTDDEAVELYLWNARVGAAFSELVGHLEVLLRNAIHEALTTHHDQLARPPGLAWFDEPNWTKHHWFSTQASRDLQRATRRARHDPPASSRPGKTVSELSFGFWRYLLAARYEQGFWVPALDAAFSVPGPNAARRRETLEDSVSPLHQLRNRVAHHEPLINDVRVRAKGGVVLVYPWPALVTAVFEIAEWISPEARELVEHADRVSALLPQRP